jgi:hypothetical protein
MGPSVPGIRRFLPFSLSVLVVALSGILAFGQTTGTGTITGTVKDASGGVIPSTKITATHLQTGRTRTVMTNASGNYTLPQLAIGDYEIRAEKSGFKLFDQKGITLNADTVLPLNITLQVGQMTQTLTVEATPPAL